MGFVGDWARVVVDRAIRERLRMSVLLEVGRISEVYWILKMRFFLEYCVKEVPEGTANKVQAAGLLQAERRPDLNTPTSSAGARFASVK